jgi:hypothetical protein
MKAARDVVRASGRDSCGLGVSRASWYTGQHCWRRAGHRGDTAACRGSWPPSGRPLEARRLRCPAPAGPEQGTRCRIGVVRSGGHLRCRRGLPGPPRSLPGVRREPDWIRRTQAWYAPAQHPGQDDDHVRKRPEARRQRGPGPRSGTTQRLPAQPAAQAGRPWPPGSGRHLRRSRHPLARCLIQRHASSRGHAPRIR